VTETQAVIRWESPPPDARGGPIRTPKRDYAPVAAALRARPGEWAVIAELPHAGGSSLAHRINHGVSKWRPRFSFQATARYRGGGTVVYARYVGVDRRGV
jgi:hypothetical protein